MGGKHGRFDAKGTGRNKGEEIRFCDPKSRSWMRTAAAGKEGNDGSTLAGGDCDLRADSVPSGAGGQGTSRLPLSLSRNESGLCGSVGDSSMHVCDVGR